MTRITFATAACAVLLMTPAAWAQGLGTKDKSFIDTAQDSNYAEAALGQMAQEKGGSPAVQEFGRWMATDHGFAEKRLNGIAVELGYHYAPKLSEKDRALQAHLAKASGQHFDSAYAQAMVEAHEKAVSAFKAEAEDGQQGEVKAYAANLLPVLEQHLAEAKDLAGAASPPTLSGSSVSPRPHR